MTDYGLTDMPVENSERKSCVWSKHAIYSALQVSLGTWCLANGWMRWDRSAISHWAVVVLGVSGRGVVGLVFRLVVADFWYGGWSLGAGLTWSLIFFGWWWRISGMPGGV